MGSIPAFSDLLVFIIYHNNKEYHTRHGKRRLPYKEMSKISLFHVNKMAAIFCSVSQQLYYYLQRKLWDDG